MLKKIVLYSLIGIFVFGLFSFSVLAEEVDDFSDSVPAEELGVEEPGILSWLENAFNTVQLWITRDLVKKSDLELKKASRQIVKAREMVQNDGDDKNLENKFSKIDEKYQGLIDGINGRIQKFQEDNPDSSKFNGFLDKYTSQQMLHQEIMKKLEGQVPEAVMAKIQEKRQEHLNNFGEVMNKLQEREEFKERLGNTINDEQQRTESRIRAMDTIDELEETAKEEVRAIIIELKQEKKEIFDELKTQKQEMKGNSQDNNSGSGNGNTTQQQTNTSNQGEDSQLQNSTQQGSEKDNQKGKD